MDSLELIKMMASQIRHLPVDIKEVKVKHKPHPKSEQKQCYNNSYHEMVDHGKEDSLYVLGYLLLDMKGQTIPIEHAWVKHGNEYFDVTLDMTPTNKYVSLVEISFEEMLEFVDVYHHAPDIYMLNRFYGTNKKK